MRPQGKSARKADVGPPTLSNLRPQPRPGSVRSLPPERVTSTSIGNAKNQITRSTPLRLLQGDVGLGLVLGLLMVCGISRFHRFFRPNHHSMTVLASTGQQEEVTLPDEKALRERARGYVRQGRGGGGGSGAIPAIRTRASATMPASGTRMNPSWSPSWSPSGNPSSASAFGPLGLAPDLVATLHVEGYSSPTPIQLQAIPPALKGCDIVGIAQTGTGKTAAFALPLIQRIPEALEEGVERSIRVLVLTPTRELAIQVAGCFATYGAPRRLNCLALYGGVKKNKQRVRLAAGVDVLVATPGRFLDLWRERRIRLKDLQAFVLDEADQMFDMGFAEDLQIIIQRLPKARQTLLFSATMPPAVERLAAKLLRDPVRVRVDPERPAAATIAQRVIFVPQPEKTAALLRLLRAPKTRRVLVFRKTKLGSELVCKKLVAEGIAASSLHSDLPQPQREQTLKEFQEGKVRVLIATDVAARGLDIADVSHVVNFDLPDTPEGYVHRIGRTGRCGHLGCAVAFCNPEERKMLQTIEALLGHAIPTITNFGELPM